MRGRLTICKLMFVIAPFGLGLCSSSSVGPLNQHSDLKLEPVYTYRLPFVPDAYWALPVPGKPMIVVASFQRPSGSSLPRFDAFLVDWQSQKEIASEELSIHFNLDSPDPGCPKGDPFRERFVAAFEKSIAVKLCARLMTFQLPSLSPQEVLLDVRPDGELDDIAASGDGRFLAAVFRPPASGDLKRTRKIVVYDTASWKVRATMKIEPTPAYIHSISLSRDGAYVAVASPIVVKGFGNGNHIYVLDTTTGSLISEFDLKPLPSEAGYHSPPYFFGGPECQWLLSSGQISGTKNDRLYVWDWRIGDVVRVISDRRGTGRLLDVSFDGSLVAADVRGDSDVALYFPIRDFKIFDIQSGEAVHESPTYWWRKRWGNRPVGTNFVQLQLQFSSDGKHAVDASGYGEVVVYSVTR